MLERASHEQIAVLGGEILDFIRDVLEDGWSRSVGVGADRLGVGFTGVVLGGLFVFAAADGFELDVVVVVGVVFREVDLFFAFEGFVEVFAGDFITGELVFAAVFVLEFGEGFVGEDGVVFEGDGKICQKL